MRQDVGVVSHQRVGTSDKREFQKRTVKTIVALGNRRWQLRNSDGLAERKIVVEEILLVLGTQREFQMF